MRPLLQTTWIELKLFIREPLTVMFTLALPLIFLFVLGGIFGNTPNPTLYRGAGPLDFYVPGYLGLVWAAVGLLAMPVQLARYREEGVLRRLRASGAPMATVFGSQVALAFLISAVGGVLVIVSASLVYDVHAPAWPMGVVVAWLACGLLFSALGLLLSTIPSSRGALGAGLGLFFVMMMLSGVGPPPEILTGPMTTVSDILPLTYMVRLLQDPWLGLESAWTDSAAVIGFALAGLIGWRLLVRPE